jgi:glycosyltransferase involved in cell wall biosynthesis/GR25 family glycosyltransferase involved in LPS biosynthesis
MKKLLIITPHLSTGGLPQFLLKKIEILIKKFDVSLVEWDDITGGRLVIQKDRIRNILGDKLISLYGEKEEILEIINNIRPDIIHFEEFPETFVKDSILKSIYIEMRDVYSYVITETTHGTLFNKADKKYLPDRTMFVSDINMNQYKSISTNPEIISMDIDNSEFRNKKLIDLELDPSYKHVMNVGLFNRNKNQSEVFEYARKMLNHKVKFHFFGNMAGNFEDYWRPLIDNKPDNCIIWDERNDLHKFYSCMDLFLFTSKLENRPLSVVEALSNNMNVLMYNLPNYKGEFSNYENVEFLTNDFDYNTKIIKKALNINDSVLKIEETKPVLKIEKSSVDKGYKISAYHMLTDIDTDREIKSMMSLVKLKDYDVKYNTCINKRWSELPPSENCQYPEKISMEPGGKLTPGHYGCYLAHKDAFYRGINTDSDFIFIFECDAVIDVEMDEFMRKVKFACNILNKTDLLMFSFGYHNNSHIIDKFDDYWTVNKFYGAHAYLIPRKSFSIIDEMYKNSKWNVSDLLFVENLDQYKTGIFEVPPTKQSAGYSILDKIYNDDRH